MRCATPDPHRICGVVDIRGHDAIGLKTAIVVHESNEARCQEAGHEHQRDAHGDLNGNKNSAHALAAARLGC